METWQFYQDEEAEWCWRYVAPTGVETVGPASFSSRTDCIADAMRHGYLARTTIPPLPDALTVSLALGR